MKRDGLVFCLGVWLAGTVLFGVVAAENFYTIDRLLAGSRDATFHAAVDRIGTLQTRELLRYLSSELNRLYFQLWNFAQLTIGIPMLWSAWRMPSRKVRWGLAVMLGLVALLTVWLAPQIVSVGRTLDFAPRDPAPLQLPTFWMLHGIYTVLDLVKLFVGVIVAFWIHQGSREPGEGRAAGQAPDSQMAHRHG